MYINNDNKRIVKNTLMLYVRMVLIMIITLYTSRIVIEALGIEDYGIYNIVGGLVVAFSLLTNSLSSVGARFITYHLGCGEFEKLRSVYSNTVNIQLYISIIIIIVAETIGLWFLNYKLNIPEHRIYAANWVYQFSVLTFIVKLLYVPYNSLIIAHEKMSVYAYVSIIEAFFQLVIVFLLLFIKTDSLILYSIFTFVASVLVWILYHCYCRKQFDECRYSIKLEKKIFKDMASFAGWNVIGTSAGVLRNQGVDIIVNLFFGVTINAARGISNQVNVAVTRFTQNFVTAINPQITKSYALGDYDRLHSLVLQGAKFSYYLLLFISLPIIIEAPYILKIWLTDVPEHSAAFTRLQIIVSLIASLSMTNITAMLATGNIKKYQIIVGCISLLNFPISYFALAMGFNAASTYIVAIFIEILCLIARFYMSKKLIGLGFRKFFQQVGFRILFISLLCPIVPLLVSLMMCTGFVELVTVCSVSFLSSAIIIMLVGLRKNEKDMIVGKIKSILYR